MKIASTRHDEGPGSGHAINYDEVLRFLPVKTGDEDTAVRGGFSGEEMLMGTPALDGGTSLLIFGLVFGVWECPFRVLCALIWVLGAQPFGSCGREVDDVAGFS